MKTQTETTKTLYQINGKGNKVAKIGGAKSEAEATLYLLKIATKAVAMEPKQGSKYLRTLGVSKLQPLYFESFNTEKLRALKTIRIGQFIETYSKDTLIAILEEATTAL
jgi:hypothetical protein